MAIQKLFTSRVKNTLGTTFVGERGRLFYDENTGELRLSDGVTPGGNPIHIHAANTIYDHSIIPAADNTYDLGSELLRWRSVYIGPGTLYIQDQNNAGLNCALTVLDGVLKIDGANQLQVGQLKFINNTIESTDVTTDIVLGTDDGSDTGNISAYRTYQLRDGNDNVLMQIQNEDGVGKLKFDGGSNGIWYDGGVVIKGVGYQADNTSIQPMSFNSATGAVTYGQLNYNHFVGFPRLPNYANDAAANDAAGTPLKGMQYYNTTTDKAMVYTASGWQAMN